MSVPQSEMGGIHALPEWMKETKTVYVLLWGDSLMGTYATLEKAQNALSGVDRWNHEEEWKVWYGVGRYYNQLRIEASELRS